VTIPGSQSQSPSQSRVSRRWTVIASGLLVLALALVVIYTGPAAFFSPIALVVVAAIGLAALLLPGSLSSGSPQHPFSSLAERSRRPLCPGLVIFGFPSHDAPHARLVAFAAVVCFGISGSLSSCKPSAAPFDRSAPLRSSSDNRLCQWRAGRPRPAEMDPSIPPHRRSAVVVISKDLSS
jgi:hypothetical protein